nr:MAG TPA: hypothetical protein [Caudoviricetes sp.]
MKVLRLGWMACASCLACPPHYPLSCSLRH